MLVTHIALTNNWEPIQQRREQDQSLTRTILLSRKRATSEIIARNQSFAIKGSAVAFFHLYGRCTSKTSFQASLNHKEGNVYIKNEIAT